MSICDGRDFEFPTQENDKEIKSKKKYKNENEKCLQKSNRV